MSALPEDGICIKMDDGTAVFCVRHVGVLRRVWAKPASGGLTFGTEDIAEVRRRIAAPRFWPFAMIFARRA